MQRPPTTSLLVWGKECSSKVHTHTHTPWYARVEQRKTSGKLYMGQNNFGDVKMYLCQPGNSKRLNQAWCNYEPQVTLENEQTLQTGAQENYTTCTQANTLKKKKHVYLHCFSIQMQYSEVKNTKFCGREFKNWQAFQCTISFVCRMRYTRVQAQKHL